MFISSEYNFSSLRGFIVVDGVNGAGKGTYIQKLADFLRSNEIEPLLTREPGGSELGNKLRPLILGEKCLGSLTELFLFSADRNEHVEGKIEPALNNKQFVISDRYYYSTTAFQGFGRGLPLDKINYINKLAINNCYPDLLILLDIDPALGLARTKKRNSAEIDKMESEELAFHTRIRNGFLELGKTCQEACLLVDASCSPEEVWRKTEPYILKLIEQWKKQ